jgi:5-methylcytosine-specific restriction endonuclease McrA
MAQPFDRLVIDEAWKRDKGCCVVCGRRCVKPMMGGNAPAAWEAHHVDPDGPLTVDNCQIWCIACHRASKK